ncbi:MAG: Ser-Thr-rich GPI-anchored membrane family protein, partial [Candidatus Latescibacterota bacterium]
DIDNASVIDVSDAVFTVAPATGQITVTAPNGGEKWNSGSSEKITWTSTGVSYVNVEYSRDGGVTWILVQANVNSGSGTGSYPITAPSIVSLRCLVRVTDAKNAAVADVSDAVFSITPAAFVKILSPLGGEKWTTGETIDIVFRAFGVKFVRLEYSLDTGTTWKPIADRVDITTLKVNANTDELLKEFIFTWTAPAVTIAETKCMVRVIDADAAAVFDRSPGVFTISPAPFIRLTSPAGGETWDSGTINDIIWKCYGVKAFKLEFSRDNGSTWNIITARVEAAGLKVLSPVAEAVKEYAFAWETPVLNANAGNCLVRVSDADAPAVLDRSRGVFTIASSASLTLKKPMGGETLFPGESFVITWTASAAVKTVNILFSTDSGATWTVIQSGVSASSVSYWWTVPPMFSSRCRIRVVDPALNIGSMSASDFTIAKPSILVFSPNGGETLQAGTTYTVSWKAEGIKTVGIEYTTDDWKTFAVIAQDVDAAKGSYSWTVPDLNTTTCVVTVYSMETDGLDDDSDNYFTIKGTTQPKVTLLYPNGGETFFPGETVTIRWQSAGVSNVNIAFYADLLDENYDQMIGLNVNAALGEYTWTVPDKVTATGAIFVAQTGNGSIIDSNDAFFSIARTLQPSLVLTSPKNGDSFKPGDTVTIRWISENIDQVGIVYTSDDWNTEQIIALNISASQGAYTWTVPYANSDVCQMYIQSMKNEDVYAFSEGYFSIKPGAQAYMQLTSPNGGEVWTAGSSQTIRWTAQNSSGVKIEYSTDGGANWKSAAASVNAAAGSFSWTVPNEVSGNCRVRISDIGTPSVTDTSDGNFSIVSSNTAFITVTSPMTGNRWYVGATYDIKWDFNGVSGVKIELSTDNGTTWKLVSDNPASAASGTYSWKVPDEKSKQCVIRVSDRTDGAISSKSGTFEILVPELLIVHTPVTQARENESLTFTATVTGSPNMVVKLNYGATGSGNVNVSRSMSKGANDTYTFTLEQGVFTGQGLEYTISAVDTSNVNLRAKSPEQGFYSIRAQVDNMVSTFAIQSGSEQNSYRMISIPLQLTRTYITDQMVKLPKGEMGTDWRLFRFSPGETDPNEYPNIDGFSPGAAFWLITRNEYQLSAPEGVTVSTAEPFTMTLKPGWNDIANPWLFDISWNDIENPSSANLSKPYGYEGNWSDPTSASPVMKPWKGYAVKNMENRNVVIRLIP